MRLMTPPLRDGAVGTVMPGGDNAGASLGDQMRRRSTTTAAGTTINTAVQVCPFDFGIDILIAVIHEWRAKS